MGEYNTIDLTYLEDISGGEEEIIVEMIQLFLDNAPIAIHNIREHYEQEDWDKLAREAHKFKPNLAYMGIEDGRELTEQIEQTAKKQDGTGGLGEKIDRVESICERAYGELNSVLKDLT